MKKYVIIATSLSNMGGAQMYIRNKILYYRSQGWNVSIISALANNIVISDLKEFRDVIPELQYSKYYYRKSRQIRVMETMRSIVADNNYEEIIIESTTIELTTWAEPLAKMVGARHLVYLLQEKNVVTNSGLQNYFIFKHRRHELAGIVNTSLSAMFKDFYPLKEGESYSLPAYCNNVEADVDCDIINSVDREKYDYIVGALSRLDKPFVMHAVKDFCNYAAKYPDKRYLFLWIGNAPDGSTIPSTIEDMIHQCPNIELLITGYLYPVPTRLLESCDVFISSAGSSHVCSRSGVPTISYDGRDFKPIGVLNRTTKNSLFRDPEEKPQPLDFLLDQILIDKKFEVQPPSYRKGFPDFQTHLDFMKKMSPTKEYFEMDTVRIESKGEWRVALGLLLFGPNGYKRLHHIKR